MTSGTALVFLTNLAALITAVAALFTALEMRRQRRGLYRPELVCEPAPFVFHRLRPSRAIPYAFSAPGTGAVSSLLGTTFYLRCTNVGLGPARNLEYRWSFDIQGTIEQIAEAAEGDPMIWNDGMFLSIGNERIPGRTHNLAPQMSGSQVVVPSGQSGSSILLTVPWAYLDVVSLHLAARLSTDDRTRSLWTYEPPALTLELRYRDVAGRPYTKRVIVTPALIMIAAARLPEESKDSVPCGEGTFKVVEA